MYTLFYHPRKRYMLYYHECGCPETAYEACEEYEEFKSLDAAKARGEKLHPKCLSRSILISSDNDPKRACRYDGQTWTEEP